MHTVDIAAVPAAHTTKDAPAMDGSLIIILGLRRALYITGLCSFIGGQFVWSDTIFKHLVTSDFGLEILI